ncbi:hypothetical protein Gbem_2556 [Citrifermentans bemidjiense Bem]|uniref:Uncharacterized protein n=1 Tax=Citrifermentans bemidjiense (strain ATCC BAA-1014 / DSM 16622 / JCM 12645 / Bem) TaxID=404380 RepID=B5EGT1_CITBB|nr:contractile injection system tape measure protein [Citrifermentans bemidjiense]ACH39564.1 hypothetical protein Gbem_2556 [Citrifermentans bemidjiense Bem]
MTHIVRQQILEVEFDGAEAEAPPLQRRLQRLCYDHLMPAIEQALDKHSIPGQLLYLERLELDVGEMLLERLELDLPESLARALERSLREETAAAQAGDAVNVTLQQGSAEAFLQFLETGMLPWWFRLPSGMNFEQVLLELLASKKRSESGSDKVATALPRILASPLVRRRLLLQFSQDFLSTLLALVSPQGWEAVNAFLVKLDRLAIPTTAGNIAAILWEEAFTAVARGKEVAERDLTAAVWLSLPPDTQKSAAPQWEVLWPGISAPVSDGVAEPTDSASGKQRDKVSNQELAFTGTHAALRLSPQSEAEAGIYLDNAGLVLLHPFLPQLFRALQVARDEELLLPERALALLHFLATGSEVAPEYQLMLAKVLCGIDLNTTVRSRQELAEAERKECEALLEAAIHHWGALGNSSANALRGTFLLRPGKLTLRSGAGEWLLQVEASGYDILLGQLPWGISMVKLPWMERMLRVEWL